MKETISVGLLGFGTVGTGVYKMIQENQTDLQYKVGCNVEVKKVLIKDVSKEREIPVSRELLTTDANDVLYDPDIDVVIEVAGGIETARRFILTAFAQKKHVVTANKDLIALYGDELFEAAKDSGCDLFFEASVAGGIPIIRALVDGLASDRITRMMGIVNGTSNYILTKMSKHQLKYEDVLSEAQAKGFAEADPSADVDGLDAARKMAILSMLGFSTNVSLEDVTIEGMSELTNEDIDYGKRLGYVIKLLGIAKRNNGSVEVSVQPTLISEKHPLASVDDEYNAVFVNGESVGETMFYGPGAGQLPTATAVVSDVIAVLKNMRLGVCGNAFRTSYYKKQLKRPDEIRLKNFFRLFVKDQPGVFSQITSLFAAHEISMEKIIQKPFREENAAEIVIVTHENSKELLDKVHNALLSVDVVLGIKSRLRVEGC